MTKETKLSYRYSNCFKRTIVGLIEKGKLVSTISCLSTEQIQNPYVIYFAYDKFILNAKTLRRKGAKEIYDSKTLRLSVVVPLRSKK